MPLICIAGWSGEVAKIIMDRGPPRVTLMIRGRSSSQRYIRNRCKWMYRVGAELARRRTTPSIGRFRIPAKYASGSVNVRTALEGIPYLLEPGSHANDSSFTRRKVDINQLSAKIYGFVRPDTRAVGVRQGAAA